MGTQTRRIAIALVSILTLLNTYSLPLVSAVEIHPNAGTTSASFLKLGLGSRAVALGGAFTALADDASALYWNPAGLALLENRQVSFTHNESFESIRHDFLGYAHPLSKGVLGAALYGLYTPKDLERRSGLRENDPYEPISPVEGYFQTYDMAAHVSYARAFRKDLFLGASVKFIQQTIDSSQANSVAADVGALYRSASLPLTLGFTAQHMGTPVKFRETAYALPFTLKGGAAWRWSPKLVTTLDLNKPVDNFLFVAAGTEYLPFDMLALRAGYRYRVAGLELGDLSGLSAGVGFTVPVNGVRMQFDYAFVPYGVLGNSHRVSVSVLFAPAKPSLTRAPAKETAASPAKKTVPAAPVTLPAAPVAPAASKALREGYAYYPAVIASRARLTTGRSRIFAVSGTSDKSDLVSFEGFSRSGSAVPDGRIGERKGEGAVYKYFDVSGDASLPLRNVTCKLRLPRSIQHPLVVTESGQRVEPVRVIEDGDWYYYQCILGTLEPFRVENK